VGIKLAEQYKNTGSLLVSAVADELSGITDTVNAICTWLTDPGRFSEKWIVADVEFSHGICPDCAEEHYPEFYLDSECPDKL
jgi:hypothetical protein